MSLIITLYQSKEISPISDILIYPRVNHSTTPDKNPPSPLSRLLISAALVPGVWVRVWGWRYQYGPLGPNGRISDLDAFNPTHLDALVILRHPVFHTRSKPWSFHTSCRGKWASTWSLSWWARSWAGNANFVQQCVCNAKAFTENLRMRSIIRNANASGSPEDKGIPKQG